MALKAQTGSSAIGALTSRELNLSCSCRPATKHICIQIPSLTLRRILILNLREIRSKLTAEPKRCHWHR